MKTRTKQMNVTVKGVPLVINQPFLKFDKKKGEHYKYNQYVSALITIKDEGDKAMEKFARLKIALSCLYGECVLMGEERNLTLEERYDEERGCYREVFCVPFCRDNYVDRTTLRKDFCEVIREVMAVNCIPFLVKRNVVLYN